MHSSKKHHHELTCDFRCLDGIESGEESRDNFSFPTVADTLQQQIAADAYFFDIDGTLLVTRDLVHWNGLHRAMLEVYGIDTTIEGIPYHGKTDVAILRAALSRCGVTAATFDAGVDQARATVCREVAANATGITPDVCPAIPDVLAELQGRGKLLGVASGNLEVVGWHKVAAAGLRSIFSVGSFGERCGPSGSRCLSPGYSKARSRESKCQSNFPEAPRRAEPHLQSSCQYFGQFCRV